MFGQGGIMSLFRGNGQQTPEMQQTAQQQQQQAATQQTNGQPVNQPNPVADPTQVPPANQPSGEVSPLERYKDLWEDKEGEQKADSFDPENFIQVDPAKVGEELQKVNFLQGANPELLAKVAQGGEEAVGAMAELMNMAARNALQASLLVNKTMTQTALQKALPAVDNKVNTQLRKQGLSSELQQLNPALKSPLAQPIVESIQDRLIQKYPNATSQELAQMANEILSTFVSQSGQGQGQQQTQQAGFPGFANQNTVDWDAFYTKP